MFRERVARDPAHRGRCKAAGAVLELALRAERKSPQTLKDCGEGVRLYLEWCTDKPAEPFARAALNLWMAELLDNGAAAATAPARQLAVRRFTRWLVDGGENPTDPFRGVKAPMLDERVIDP